MRHAEKRRGEETVREKLFSLSTCAETRLFSFAIYASFNRLRKYTRKAIARLKNKCYLNAPNFDDVRLPRVSTIARHVISVLVHRNSSSGQFLKIVILIVRTSTSIPHVLKFKLLSFFYNGKHNRPLMAIACKISTIIEIKRPFHPQIIACKRKNWSRYL